MMRRSVTSRNLARHPPIYWGRTVYGPFGKVMTILQKCTFAKLDIRFLTLVYKRSPHFEVSSELPAQATKPAPGHISPVYPLLLFLHFLGLFTLAGFAVRQVFFNWLDLS
jgi:hypothetical protein